MSAEKITRKELKHDGMVDAVFSISIHLQQHIKIYISLAALLIIGAIIIGVMFYQDSQKNERAVSLLAHARGPESLERIFRDYPETESAPLALFLMADLLYRQGGYQSARQKYELFFQNYPQHVFAPFALMGAAYSAESQERWEEAIDFYRRVRQRFPQSFLVAEALYNTGRCQIRLGRREEAVDSYEEIITLHRASSYLRLASEELVKLESTVESGG